MFVSLTLGHKWLKLKGKNIKVKVGTRLALTPVKPKVRSGKQNSEIIQTDIMEQNMITLSTSTKTIKLISALCVSGASVLFSANAFSGDLKEESKDAYHEVKEESKEMGEEMKEGYEEAVEDTKELAEDAKENTKELAEDTKEKTKEAYEEARDATEDAIEAVDEEVGE